VKGELAMKCKMLLWSIAFSGFLAATALFASPHPNQMPARRCVQIASVDGKAIIPDTIRQVGYQALVRGTICDSTASVFILAHSLLETDWWVQNPPTPLSNEEWQGIALLGNEKQGEGEFFEIVAIAAANAEMFRGGQRLRSLSDTLARSDIVVVSRGVSPYKILDTSQRLSQAHEVGRIALIKGRVSNPQWSVYVLVHPMVTPKWYVQKLPSPPNADGRWQSICFFGAERAGIGEFFEVVAIFAEARHLFREGQELNMLPDGYPRSTLITVRRGR
jgi:hypothetical protein